MLWVVSCVCTNVDTYTLDWQDWEAIAIFIISPMHIFFALLFFSSLPLISSLWIYLLSMTKDISVQYIVHFANEEGDREESRERQTRCPLQSFLYLFFPNAVAFLPETFRHSFTLRNGNVSVSIAWNLAANKCSSFESKYRLIQNPKDAYLPDQYQT